MTGQSNGPAPPPSITTPTTTPVSVSLDDLKHGKYPLRLLLDSGSTQSNQGLIANPSPAGTIPSSTLEAAFGPDSLGIIVVHSLDPTFATQRSRLLSYASHLARLPEATLASLEDPGSHYLVGWSRGRETLRSGRYDTLKGSYYANPASSDPAAEAKARELYPRLPEYNAPNVWPPGEVLPGFRAAFQELCDAIVGTAALVARACDRYAVANVEGYGEGYLERVVTSSVATKARLLHYFPSDPSSPVEDGDEDDDWCATHLDHGCLTGLTSAMFLDEAVAFDDPSPPSSSGVRQQQEKHPSGFLPVLPELDTSPDPKAGLYIHSRAGAVVKVAIPRDCLAFQTGLALERITRGKFRAVPHFVRGVRASSSSSSVADDGQGEGRKVARVARNTLAVFTQPNLWEIVDDERGLDFAAFAREIVEKNH